MPRPNTILSVLNLVLHTRSNTTFFRAFSTKKLPLPEELKSQMGNYVNNHLLEFDSDKEHGVEAGRIVSLKGQPEIKVMQKFCGQLHARLNQEEVGVSDSYSGKPRNIGARKESVCAEYLYKFALRNGLFVKIPSTGVSFEFNNDDKYGITEGLLSQMEALDPYPSRDLSSYHDDIQEALLEGSMIKTLHKLLPALAILRAYDPIGQSHRNLGITKNGGHLFMCDFGVGLQEVPHGKGWSRGMMQDVVGQALPRMIGINRDEEYLDLEYPSEADYLESSERLAKIYFQAVPISAITDVEMLPEGELNICFTNGRKLPEKHPNEEKQEDFMVYKNFLNAAMDNYLEKVSERQREMGKLKEALNFIYPREKFNHNETILPNPRDVVRLFETDCGRGNLIEVEKEKILEGVRSRLENKIPEKRREFFEGIYGTEKEKSISTGKGR